MNKPTIIDRVLAIIWTTVGLYVWGIIFTLNLIWPLSVVQAGPWGQASLAFILTAIIMLFSTD